MKKLPLMLILLLILTGCGRTPQGKSIEDCMETENCSYLDNNVKTEGSELSNALLELLIDQSDELVFHYSIDPGGDSIGFEYYADRDITYDNITDLVDVMAEVIDTVNEFYSIDYINPRIFINDNLVISLYFEEDGEIDSLIATMDYNISDYDSEDDIILYLETHFDELKALLDTELFTRINWYGSVVSNWIFIDVGNNSIRVQRYGTAHTDNIDAKITDLLQDYDFDFYDPGD